MTDKADFKCLECEHIWTTIPQHMKNRKSGCPACAKKDEITRYKVRFREFLKKEKLELLSELKGYRDEIEVRCKVCKKEWVTYPMRLKAPKSKGCTDCNAEKRRIEMEKEFKEYLKTRDDLEMIGNFKRNYLKAKFKCRICDKEWSSIPDDIKKNYGCPFCKLSKGEKGIEKYLKEKGIEYISQWSEHNCIYKKRLRFDFYLPELNLVIEFQGKQHYEYIPFFHRTKKNYLNCQMRDLRKKEYCKEHKINYLEISYLEQENISYILDHYLYENSNLKSA